MLFNSPIYIFLFLPATVVVYYTLKRFQLARLSRVWLVFASLCFYSYWNPVYTPLLAGSAIFNYFFGRHLSKSMGLSDTREGFRKLMLWIGVGVNLGLLGYFKYADFFITNLNSVTGTTFSLLHLVLPLAISFFTFQQIAFLVDSYRGNTEEYHFLNYCLFVTFFPQLIAGPIVHHREMMPQFGRNDTRYIQWENLAQGLAIFIIGLFKKVVVADTFAVWATQGFDQLQELTFMGAWVASLSYSLQLYFDFSGYTDMAIGSALLFNIHLPLNFNSPYKALDIQDFWRRWHMTLGRWLRNYIYIPLGGNRMGERRTYINLFLTFLLGGLWHGAGWTFIVWGALHGIGAAVNRGWHRMGFQMPKWLAWLITFNFVNLAWVFFRARSFDDALKVLKGMAGLNGFSLPKVMDDNALEMALVFLLVAVLAKNSRQIVAHAFPGWRFAGFVSILGVVSILSLTKISEFLYFQF